MADPSNDGRGNLRISATENYFCARNLLLSDNSLDKRTSVFLYSRHNTRLLTEKETNSVKRSASTNSASDTPFVLHETRKQFIEPRGHDSSNNKASATPRFRRRRERGVATRERGVEWRGLTRKMERKYRDEGWHNPSDADRLPRRLPTSPFASVAFLVALMKGPSIIVLISLRFHLSLSSSFPPSLFFSFALVPPQSPPLPRSNATDTNA